MSNKDEISATGQKSEITLIVSGAAVTLVANLHQPLKSLIERALKEASEASTPEKWGFFVENGKEMVPLDENLKVEEVLAQGLTVYLNQKAGIAG